MKIKADTIARTIVLVIALVNQILTSTGKNPLPFAEDTVYQLITLVITIISSVSAWWYNNSFTTAAIVADDVKEAMIDGRVTVVNSDEEVHYPDED